MGKKLRKKKKRMCFGFGEREEIRKDKRKQDEKGCCCFQCFEEHGIV